MGKRRKQRQRKTKAAVDRDVISRLPDEILCNILSFLPTRTSVATSVLSRRWRYLWKKVQALDLSDDFFYTPELSRDEAQERFLIFLKEFEPLLLPLPMRKFRLSCPVGQFGYTDLIGWIEHVIGRVSELYFSVRSDGQTYELYFRNLHSTSLVSLVLDGNIMIVVDFVPTPSESIFPSLKNLELNVIFNYVDLDLLLSGCPALETLRITLTDFRLEAFHMPRSLKSLTFEEQYSDSEDVTLELLEVNTPSLEYLRLSLRGCYAQILVCDYPNIKKASLDISRKSGNIAWVPKLLRALCKTKFLWLQVSTIECLICAPVLVLPDFCNLIQLQLDFHSFQSSLLIDLLHSCPKLQALKIYISQCMNSILSGSYLKSHNGWTQPLSIPHCIVSHLNTVEHRGYLNTPEEHEFTAYILQRGLVLKTMRIHTKYNLDSKCEIYEALSQIQKGSSMCRLEVKTN
ncbi:hypothetical protein HN51_053179 [Arachis hypogaea]|uniref:F-box/FBD/LRR-repeat protein n=2 Tax=Arachis TaxID=3817 RepID=A0A6B9V2B8_ARAHY|nr:FBD-associated F-box protein At4g10400 [Arachis hypogaea]QHN75493.1 F-box/FBD/LRR-repeat protein [Arachis hypogaea]